MAEVNWTGIIGAVVTLLTLLGTGYAAWMKIQSGRDRDAVAVLARHIRRVEGAMEAGRRREEKLLELVNELYDHGADCELNEEMLYGWAERANGVIAAATGNPLQLPPRRTRERIKRAEYLKVKAEFDSVLSAETSNAVLASRPDPKGGAK